LPRKWMERHPSFVLNEESLVQRNLRGEQVKNLDELLEVARLAKPKFDAIMTNIVRDSGLDPAMTVVSPKDGKPLMIDHNTPFRVLSLARLKGVDRMAEKAKNELKGDFSRLVDVVRCSVVVFTEEQLESVSEKEARRQRREETATTSTTTDRDCGGAPQESIQDSLVQRLSRRSVQHRDLLRWQQQRRQCQ